MPYLAKLHLRKKDNMPTIFKLPAAVMLVASLASSVAFANEPTKPENWVTTWFASPQPIWTSEFVLPTNIPSALAGQTVREVIKVSAGGKRVRLVFSNRYGKTPLVIGEVRIAMSRESSSILTKTERLVTFDGHRSVTVPPGAPVVSDPIAFDLAPLSHLGVTSFYPERAPLTTFHWGDQQTAFTAEGNLTAAPVIEKSATVKGRLFLSALLVDAPQPTRTVVTFGDSITDGNGSTPDRDRRWPDLLAEKFVGSNVAVANAGISGARLLGDLMGENALARFDQDVLAQPGVKAVVVLIGINDIGWPGSPFAKNDPQISADQLVAGYTQLIARARAHNIRIIGATLLPFEGALRGTPFEGHYSPAKERTRQLVNRWIRTSGAFDHVVDFDAVVRDPSQSTRIRPDYDSGDHLHPGDAGYKAMADAFDLNLLFGK